MTGDLPRGEVFLREKGPISLPSLFVLSIYIYTLYRASLDLEKSSKLIETLMDDG